MKVLIVLPLFLTLFFYCQEIQGFIKPSLKLLRESLQKALEERLVENKNQLEKFKKAQFILGMVTDSGAASPKSQGTPGTPRARGQRGQLTPLTF